MNPLIEKYEEELREKDSTIRAYQNGVIANYHVLHKKLIEMEIMILLLMMVKL